MQAPQRGTTTSSTTPSLTLSNVDDSDPQTDAVNYVDGYHRAASITVDSPSYNIKRFKLGTLPTYVEP